MLTIAGYIVTHMVIEL